MAAKPLLLFNKNFFIMDIMDVIGLKSDGGSFMVTGIQVQLRRGILFQITDLGSGALTGGTNQIRFYADDGRTEMSFMQPFGHMNGGEYFSPPGGTKAVLIAYNLPGGDGDPKFRPAHSEWTDVETITLPEWWGELEELVLQPIE